MKQIIIVIIAGGVLFGAEAQTVVSSVPADQNDGNQIISIERGPHHEVLARVKTVTNAMGKVMLVTNRVAGIVESGLHYYSPDTKRMEKSEPVVRPHPKGAAALNGQIKAVFGPDLDDPVAIESPSGHRFQTALIGLAYLDRASGKMMLVATVKPRCEGFIFPPEKVAYMSAFDGAEGNVIYQISKAGVAQDVVLHQIPDAKISDLSKVS